ncbi:MAG: hypothetical protein ACPGWM_08040 [Flavobacteriales bacterium]
MKYDDASWHSGGEGFPKSSPDEYGGVHIALFLKWCFVQGWASELHSEHHAEEVQKVVEYALENGVILFWFLSSPQAFRLAPPLNIGEIELDQSLSVLTQALNTI